MEYFTSILINQEKETEFNRIKNQETVSSVKIPYNIEYINYLMSIYESEEDYEKCNILLKYRNSKIDSHDHNFLLLYRNNS